MHALVRCDDTAGEFMTELIDSFPAMYAADRVPEIADDIIQIDNGLMINGFRLGFWCF